jgi:exosortase/archaeosortase family protein
MAAELNARIGRTLPSPMFGVLVDACGPAASTTPPIAPRLSRVGWLLAALLAALWPHWIYMTRRTFDGSDEPWGVLALVTVFVLLTRERRGLAVPTRAALVASGVLAVAAAFGMLWLPPLAAAAVGMLALGMFIGYALPQRPRAPLIALLMLALPVIASLQFYLGFPLRAFTAQAVALLLGAAGLDASAAGASILFQGNTILVDAPCAGIGMLWVGSYTAALLSYLQRAASARTALNALAAALLVLAANIARNGALFFPGAGLVHWPAWSHEAIGLAAFALAIVPLVVFIHRTRQ